MTAMTATGQAQGPSKTKDLFGHSLGALGIVFGDIGTSPLYALRECLHGPHGVEPTRANVLGVLSLVFWALILIVSVKYLAFVLRANNKGEGGILALMALASSGLKTPSKRHRAAIILGLFGAALLYGDGMITPAISVLSAVEGLQVAAPRLDPFVVPMTITILIGLFSIQSRGTSSIGFMFGPITLVWFLSLATLGGVNVVAAPEVLAAVNPLHGLHFLVAGNFSSFLALGAVFLVVTGGEALYADMGHFGTRPIRLTWFAVVLPSLVLNYFGQGALLLQDPSAASNPFFRMVPNWALYPMIGVSTLATIIASQALISGAFSLTRQALMLGYLPRLRIEHTSPKQVGQIYVPQTNWILMLATIGLVLGFGSSSRLAAAYGIAVTLTMMVTTLLAYVVARKVWHWPLPYALFVTLLFFVPDVAFFTANAVKVLDGGWFPLVVAGFVFTLMTTWKRGRELVGEQFRANMLPLDDFFEIFRVEIPARVRGTAVYMTSNREGTPPALLHNFEHNHVVHRNVVLLSVVTEETARVAESRRIHVDPLDEGFYRAIAHYGFMEEPNVPELLEQAGVPGYLPDHATFFLGRETVIPTDQPGMATWRDKVFAFLSRNAQTPVAFFKIPPDRVMEIGAQVTI